MFMRTVGSLDEGLGVSQQSSQWRRPSMTRKGTLCDGIVPNGSAYEAGTDNQKICNWTQVKDSAVHVSDEL